MHWKASPVQPMSAHMVDIHPQPQMLPKYLWLILAFSRPRTVTYFSTSSLNLAGRVYLGTSSLLFLCLELVRKATSCHECTSLYFIWSSSRWLDCYALVFPRPLRYLGCHKLQFNPPCFFCFADLPLKLSGNHILDGGSNIQMTRA